MKIKNIKVNAYGTLEQKEIELGDHINLIYGQNESGKSTLLNFIKSSFYGINRTKNGRDISDYDRYKPWHTDEFSGKLTYQLDNGAEYQIYRDFKKKAPQLYNERLEDITNQYTMDKKEGSHFFVEQTNLEEEMFLKTIVSMQGETRLNEQEQSFLIQKLANLAGTGNDNLSYQKIVEKLNKKQLEEIGTERTLERPINLVNRKLAELEKQIQELKMTFARKDNLEQEKQEIKNQIEEKENRLQVIKKIETKLKENEIEKEKLKNKRNEKKELNDNIEKIKNEITEKNKNKINYKEENKNNLIILFIILIVLFFAIIIFENNLIKIISGIVLLFNLIGIFLIIQKNKKIKIENNIKEKEQKNEIEKLENKLEYLEQNDTILEKEIQEAEKRMDAALDQEIENISNEYKNIYSRPEIFGLFEKENNQYQNNKTTEELNNDKVKYNSFTYQLDHIQEELELLPQKEETYSSLQEEKKELQEKTRAINQAKAWMEKAYSQMQKNITPQLTENLSKNMSKISGGKYQKIVIDAENKIRIEDEKGQYIPIERLSIGTIDQMYLALRLSMINQLSSEKMPIILDESFAYFDQERLKNMLAFLGIELKNYQVILLTCSTREKEILEELQIPYKLTELA